MDVNGDGTEDLLIGEPTRNANKLEIINDGNVVGFFFFLQKCENIVPCRRHRNQLIVSRIS